MSEFVMCMSPLLQSAGVSRVGADRDAGAWSHAFPSLSDTPWARSERGLALRPEELFY